MKYALIIGNDRYTDLKLAQLKTPAADSQALARVLKDQNIGSFDEVIPLVNKTEFQVSRAISTFLTNKKPEDLVLVYFSGHGILDDRGRLFLALKDTQTSLLKSTAISSSFIADEMDSCRSKRQILILDCCHSGAFERGVKAGEEKAVTETTFEGNGFGRVVLTASDSTQYALEGDQVIKQTELSLFTHFLLEGLQTGKADMNHDGHVSLDEWYDYTYTQVLSTTPRQVPHKWSYHQQGDLIIAKNPYLKKKGVELPVKLLELIESPYSSVREAAVKELGILLHSRDAETASLALLMLEKLRGDDSRTVSLAAADVLSEANKSVEGRPELPEAGNDNKPAIKNVSVVQKDAPVSSDQVEVPAVIRTKRKELDRPASQRQSTIKARPEEQVVERQKHVQKSILSVPTLLMVGVALVVIIVYVISNFSSGNPPSVPQSTQTTQSSLSMTSVPSDTPMPTPIGGGGSIIYSGGLNNSQIFKFDMFSQQGVKLPIDDQSEYIWNFSWSPDNTQIMFQLGFTPNLAIMMMNSDGSNLHTVLKNECRNWFPDWSPDGKKILFSSDCQNSTFNIYTMSTDGSSVTRVSDVEGAAAKWSPDGKLIAFQSNESGNFDVYVMNSDGSNIHKLTDSTNDDMFPLWSPNGRQIAYQSSKDNKGQIYVMDVDGSNQVNLSNNPYGESPQSWSPDGRQILFGSDQSGEMRLYTIDVKTGFTQPLSDINGSTASWSH